MFRSRLSRSLLLIAAVVATIYVLISLFLPSSRRLIFGVDKSSGRVRMVENRVTFLPPHQFYRLTFDKRNGAAQRDGLVTILSKERVPVTISYRLRFSVSGEQIADARTLVREGWSAWIRHRVGEAISAVTQQVPIEELVSPTSEFATRRSDLRRIVAAHLARSGLNVVAFEIARIEPDREALLTYKRAELRRGARGAAGRVAIFAIDGADWELITELAADGRLPNISALARGGATANMQTIQPTVSPLLWATAATGVGPDRHGVLDFVERSNNNRPVDAITRRAPAVWDIAEIFGRHSAVVNWWTAWPPLATGATVFDAPPQLMRNAFYPPQMEQRVRRVEVPSQTIGFSQVGRFVNITAPEYDAAASGGDPNDPVNVMRDLLAKTWTDHRVGVSVYEQEKPLLVMISYDGTDIVNHLASPYHPPYREGISQEAYRKYWPTVANYYSEIDRLIGEWMNVLSDDTTVIVMSAHGFRWGKTRPREQPVGRAALGDHRNPGIFIAYGNHVVPSRTSRTITLYDIVPTVLAILGLPKSSDMPGSLATWAFKDVTPVDSVRVVSYSEFFSQRPVGGMQAVDPKRYASSLQAIGHLTDPGRAVQQPVGEEGEPQLAQVPTQLAPQQWGTYAYYNNQGVEARRAGKTKEAAEAFQKAIDVNPTRPTPYLNLAMVLFDREQYTAAEQVFLQALNRGLPNGDRWVVDFAALYRSKDQTTRATQLLYQGKKLYPQSPTIAANLGSALAQSDRMTEALPELERALGLQPSSTLVLNNLGSYYAKKEEWARALDFWNRSLAIDRRQPEIRTAANAAQTHL